MTPQTVIDFWTDAGPAKWFQRDDDFDAEVSIQFGDWVAAAAKGKLNFWMSEPEGAVALVILLDQFPRNMYREDVRAYGFDRQALQVSRDAIVRGDDLKLEGALRRWLYMPFMHSEDLSAQEEGLLYFSERLDDADTYKYAVVHADVIRQFGRFPHRNEVLERASSDEEISFLENGGFSA
ncbi:MAG: DUF924 domain-containing protein [Parvibaculaceae bacterium]|nr:DUF924 domain-containing protein [Parvibaculaceae bacterium]